MFKLSIPAVGCFIINVFVRAISFSLEFRQLRAHLGFGDDGDGNNSFTFCAYLFRGWCPDRCIPITEDLFRIELG